MTVITAGKDRIPDIIALNREVHQLHVDLFPHHFKEADAGALKEHYEAWMDEGNFRFYIAEEDGRAVGYIICVVIRTRDNPFSYGRSFIRIDQICVTEGMRGRGIGRALVDRAKQLAREEGIDTLETSYWSANKAAGEAYRKFGFTTHSERMSMKVEK